MKAKVAQENELSAKDQAGAFGPRRAALRWGCAMAATGGALLLLIALLAPGRGSDGRRGDDHLASSPAPLISVESVAAEGDRATVKIKNQSPFLVIVHSGGVRVGWLRPHRVGIIRGLTTGYHNFFAHSQYGTVSWGPKDVWVPGPWNLIY